jgi:hypothetical protein
MLANERDKNSVYYNGHDINWFDWDNYMQQLVCRCAEQALKKGYKYFGIEYWGKLEIISITRSVYYLLAFIFNEWSDAVQNNLP